eukprot:4535574-Prymnesium_polylepis.1
MFWVFGWQLGAGRTRQRHGSVLVAAAAAAEEGGWDWEAVRKGLAGELPAPTRAERVAERKRRL